MKLLKNKIWLIPITLFIIINFFSIFGAFDSMEMYLYDNWFRLRGEMQDKNDVIIVGMDAKSIQSIGALPWPRSIHGKLLDKLSAASVVGFDLVFDVPSNDEEDRLFAEGIKKHGNVILSSQFVFEKNDKGYIEQIFYPPLDILLENTKGIGFVNTPTDFDGVIRYGTIVDVNTFDVPFPSLALAVGMEYLDIDPMSIVIEKNVAYVGDKQIPINSKNQAMINFLGPRETIPTYSYIDVLNGTIPSETFKDKIILIGPVAAVSKDDFSTPFTTSNLILEGSLPVPGVEVHATIIQTLLDNSWFTEPSKALNILYSAIFTILTVLLISKTGPWLGLCGVAFSAILTVVFDYFIWLKKSIYIYCASTLLLIILIYVTITATKFLISEFERKKVKNMFSRYVSSDVVNELISNKDGISLGGYKRDITIMFCDIRGFTAYSENKAPEQVVTRLNEYLTAMTDIIFEYGGTLDKYLGDGLMAFFGAPVEYTDHIERAITVAVKIQEAVKKLNDKWTEAGDIPLLVGVGINGGEVLIGNIGSPNRMDYTVIGEDVNLASRVEGITKVFSKMITISDRTALKLKSRNEEMFSKLFYLGDVEVKGFTNKIGIYSTDY